MQYELYYDSFGKVVGVLKDKEFIKIDLNSPKWIAFLTWNKEQKTLLDLNSTTEVVKPVSVRDLAAEIDEIKMRLDTTEATLLTTIVK